MEELQAIREQTTSLAIKIAREQEIGNLSKEITSLTEKKAKLASKSEKLKSVVEYNTGKTSIIYLHGQRYRKITE
jgi:hypothetical protein